MEKILHLTLKKKWFDMIDSGEKKEEYREINQYWEDRLGEDANGKFHDVVEFRNGYQKEARRMRFIIEDITNDYGKIEWGADPDKVYFVIKLGERIS